MDSGASRGGAALNQDEYSSDFEYWVDCSYYERYDTYPRKDIAWWDLDLLNVCKLMRAATLALANHKDEYEIER